MSLKMLVNSPDVYQSFLRYVEERIKKVQNTLEQSTDLADIYRGQGEIRALRRMLTLRDEVNKMDK